MKAYVFVEGPTEVELLRRLIPPDLVGRVQFVPAGDAGSIRSLASTIIVMRRMPVAVVIDAYTHFPDLIRERRQLLEEMIHLNAASVPLKVVMAVPELEAIFFQDPHLLPKVLGRELPAEVLIRARYEPGAVLKELLAESSGVKSVEQLASALSQEDLEALKSAPPVAELIQFLNDVLRPAPTAKPTAVVS